jgi:deoxyribodipyrimidine photo-lyase
MATPLVIWWAKRDLRLADNQALTAALETARPVLPLFCFEPSVLASSDYSPMHLSAQTDAVTGLRESLRSIGGELYVSYDEVIPTFERILQHRPIEAVYSHEEIGNGLTYARDRQVAAWCRERGVGFKEFPQSSVKRGGVNRDKLHQLWQARIVERSPLPPPCKIPMTRGMHSSASKTSVRAVESSALWQAVNESAAQATLIEFLTERGLRYRGGISSPNSAMTAGSRLSVHLAWGTLSLRSVYHQTVARLSELRTESLADAGRWRQSLGSFLSRLHWRDHFIQRLESEPEMEFQALHPAYRELVWEDNPLHLEAWIHGRTGFPLVDAVMRCLGATGFVNFRMRAMVVSFACHALHLDWRTIHPRLARIFLDYDPGIHLSQLQMQAGTVGLNTVRVYNPAKQLLDHDPEYRFVSRWVPELRGSTGTDRPVGKGLGDYPAPIVDWRTRTMAMRAELYRRKRAVANRELTAAVLKKHGSRRSGERRRPKRLKPRGEQLPLTLKVER